MKPQPQPTWQDNAEGVASLCFSTADLNKVLPCVVKVEHILALGFKPWANVRAGFWWAYDDVPRILNALQIKLGEVKVKL